MLIEQFVSRYPLLYHMAESGSWPKIKARGLLSTSALLDLYGIQGTRRSVLEERHRPDKVTLDHPRYGSAVLRDQKPMPANRLRMCLPKHVSARAWYRLLNRRVFFWVAVNRLTRLLKARHYRSLEHDVLVVDSALLLTRHSAVITVAHMNSGNTFPVPHKRTLGLFRDIVDYPITRTGRPKPEIVELTVDYAVPDIRRFVVDVREMRGDQDLGSLLRGAR